MLTRFETELLKKAMVSGYEPQYAASPASSRQAIQDYLIFDVLRWNQRVVDLPEALKAELPSDIKPESYACDYIKSRLDLSHYDLGDPALEPLRQYVLNRDVDALSQALEKSPELVDRRCLNGKTLLHEAIIYGGVAREDLIALLLAKGATLDKQAPFELDAMGLAVQHGCFIYLTPAFYEYQSQFEALKAIIIRGGDSDVCMELYKNKDRFQVPCTDKQNLDLLLLATDHKYYHLMKLIVTSCQIRVPKEALLLFRHAKNDVGKDLSRVRAQVVTPGLISFMLAAGVDGSADCDRFEQFIRDAVDHQDPIIYKFSHLMELYCQLKLSCHRTLPIILITQTDYDMLESAHSLRDDRVCFLVFDLNTRKYRIIGQENAFDRFSLSFDRQLSQKALGALDELISLVYPSERSVSSLMGFSDHSLSPLDRYQYLQDVFKRYENAIKALGYRLLNSFAYPLARYELWPSQDYAMTILQRQYPAGPIPLKDDQIQKLLAKAQDRGFDAVTQYIFERAMVAEHPENLRSLLYYLVSNQKTDGYAYLQFLVRQDFTPKKPFYKWMLDAGLDLNKVERCMHGDLKYRVASTIARSQNREHQAAFYDCSDFDLLKSIKHALVFRLHHLQNGVISQAIRDSLVLGQSTLFLNIIRSNRDLTELKDTKTYLGVCRSFQGEIISADAKAELKRRVEAEDEVSLRDVALYLALGSDFENDRECWVDVCAKHLLLENPSDAQKAALNAGLRLLSVAEHNALRNGLMMVSEDARLKETLQARLSLRNCAFIEIIRTSAEDRDVKNTGSFDTWARGLKPPAQVNRFKDGAKRKVFNLFARVSVPNRDVGNANFSENDREDPGL